MILKAFQHSQPIEKEGYIPTLDGWRALAVLGVVIYHATPSGAFGFPVANLGQRGVSVFFGISGFLICSKLVSEELKYGKISLKNFYLRRAFRILPPALAYLVVIALLGKAGLLARMPLRELLSCIFFFRNYLPEVSDISGYTGHYWSLSVEEHFYLLFPALLIWGNSSRVRFIAPLLAIMVGCWRILDARYNISSPLLPPEIILSYHRTDRLADGLLFGCTLALWVNQVAFRKVLHEKLTIFVWWALVAMYITGCFYSLPFQGILDAILIPLMLYGTTINRATLVGAILEFPLLKWIGRLSYSLYLWHAIFFVGRYHQPEFLQLFPINIAALIICASASYYLIEQPMISLGRKLMKATQDRPSPRDLEAIPGSLAAADARP